MLLVDEDTQLQLLSSVIGIHIAAHLLIFEPTPIFVINKK